MIRRDKKAVTTTMETSKDRLVTPTATFDGTAPSNSMGVFVPTLDDDCSVYLQVAPREHRFNYPAMSGKPKPEGPHGYDLNGIVVEFDMDDEDGTTITDKAQGIVLTEQGDPTYAQSASTAGLGNGVTYDGTGDAHDYTLSATSVTDPLTLPETGDFSVECVFKTSDGTSGDGDTLICCRDGAAGIGWQLVFDGTDHVDFHVDDGTEVVCTGDTDVDDGSIHHVLVTLDRDGNGVIYVDGSADDTTDISGSSGTLLNESADTRFAIGGDAARTAGDCFTGTIYFVRVYNRALSATEALENYNILLNKGYPGWATVEGGTILSSQADPGYCDFSDMKVLKTMAFRALCDAEQTTTNDLNFVWTFHE